MGVSDVVVGRATKRSPDPPLYSSPGGAKLTEQWADWGLDAPALAAEPGAVPPQRRR